MPYSTRRQFLCVLAGAGGAAGLGLAARRFGDFSADPGAGLHSVTKSAWALGSDATMTVLHRDRGVAEAALEAAFAELELVEELMSVYRPHSQLSRLNRAGSLDRPHPHFVEVLHHAQVLAERTGGAFDVTVQPLWELYQQARKRGELPVEAEIAAARERVDWRQLDVAAERVELRAGARITLNGVAQGFAADRAAAALRAHGVEHALVNTGEIGAVGHKENAQPWTVGIQHPRHPDAWLSLAKLAGRCLATSGDYATFFSDDFVHHHLFDPRTGRSPQGLASVSIAADSAMAADALSTAVFVLGPDAGAELIQSTAGADVLLVLKDGTTRMTEGFPRET